MDREDVLRSAKGIFLSALAIIMVPVSASQSTLEISREWDGRYRWLRAVGNVAGDRGAELLVTSGNRSEIHVLKRDESPRGYLSVARLSEPSSARVQTLELIDIDGDGRFQIAVAWSSGALTVHEVADGTSRRASLPSGSLAERIAFGDVDGDGAKEIVISSFRSLLFYDPITLDLRGSVLMSESPSGRMRIGDIQGDAREEVVFGGQGRVSDPAMAFQIERGDSGFVVEQVWAPSRSADSFFLADLDGDGKREVIAAPYSGQLRIYPGGNLGSSRLIGQFDIIEGAWFGDVGDSGELGIAVRTGSARAVLLDLDGQAISTISMPEAGSGDGAFSIADFEGAGSLSVAYGSVSGIDVVPLIPGATDSWRVLASDRVLGAAILRPSEGRNRLAVLSAASFGSTNASAVEYWGGRLLDDTGGSGGAWLTPAPVWPMYAYQQAIVALDGRHRVSEEVAVIGAIESSSDGQLVLPRAWIFDGEGSFLRTVPLASDSRILTSKYLELPGASQPYVLNLATVQQASGSAPDLARLELLGLHDGALNWASRSFPAAFMTFDPLAVGDVTGDGIMDVIVVSQSRALLFSPSLGTQPIAEISDVRDAAICAEHLCGDVLYALLGLDGRLNVFRALSEPALYSVEVGVAVNKVGLFKQPSDSDLMVLAMGPTNGLRFYRAADGVQVGAQYFVPYFQGAPKIDIADLDRDGSVDIVLSGQELVAYRLSNPMAVFTNGFED